MLDWYLSSFVPCDNSDYCDIRIYKSPMHQVLQAGVGLTLKLRMNDTCSNIHINYQEIFQ